MSSDVVHTGFWINWSYDRVRGSTITLSSENSAFLVAFIALFVRFAGGQLWSVLSFLSSLSRSTAAAKDAIYHQQQAILRNTSQPATVLWSMLKLLWSWKDATVGAKRRTASFVFTSLAYIAAFAVAGIFSSRITSSDTEVLLLPTPNCGFWPWPRLDQFDPAKETLQDYMMQRTEIYSNFNSLIEKSHVYVAECYNLTADNPTEFCLPHGHSRIAWNTNKHAECPFDDDICLTDAIQFDSGFLNSHTHFGINSKDDRVEYRRVMTCAPIKTDGYVSGPVNRSGLNTSTGDDGYLVFEGQMYQKYSYGQSWNFNDSVTFAYSDTIWAQSFASFWYQKIFEVDFEVSLAAPDAVEPLGVGSFEAIPSLSRSDADTILISLASNATFLSEVNDPWFRATIPQTMEQIVYNNTPFSMTLYTPNAPVNVVACAEQHQLRNPSTGNVSRLGGLDVVTRTNARELGFNDNQVALFERSFLLASYGNLPVIGVVVGGGQLLAVAEQSLGTIPGLPDYQWQLEFEHWFGVALNALQLWSQEYVTGRLRPQNNQYIVKPEDTFSKDMCANQIIRRTDYRSFSVLGIGIVFGLGSLFIIMNLTIGPIVKKIQGQSTTGRYHNAEWQANDFLQLQRMAYEHNNVGTWEGHDKMVPRTRPGEVFTIPQSTKWDENIPEPPSENRRPSIFSLHRIWSHKIEASHVENTVPEESSVHEKQNVSAKAVEVRNADLDDEIARKV